MHHFRLSSGLIKKTFISLVVRITLRSRQQSILGMYEIDFEEPFFKVQYNKL